MTTVGEPMDVNRLASAVVDSGMPKPDVIWSMTVLYSSEDGTAWTITYKLNLDTEELAVCGITSEMPEDIAKPCIQIPCADPVEVGFGPRCSCGPTETSEHD